MHSVLILWSKQNSFHKTVIFFTSFTHRLGLIYIDTGIRFFTKRKRKKKMENGSTATARQSYSEI